MEQTVKRGDVYYADLSMFAGSEHGGSMKPVLIIQNDIGNKFSPCVIVSIITSQVKRKLPTHVYLNAERHGLDRDSYCLLEQIKTIDRYRLLNKVAHIDEETMKLVENAAKISIGIAN